MRDDDFSDPWGTALSWAWGIVETLYDADPSLVPSAMGYRPGMGGPEVPYRAYADQELGHHPEDVSSETNQVWEHLHAGHHQDPIYWEDPGFEARVKELVTAVLCLSRYLDWCRAVGKDY